MLLLNCISHIFLRQLLSSFLFLRNILCLYISALLPHIHQVPGSGHTIADTLPLIVLRFPFSLQVPCKPSVIFLPLLLSFYCIHSVFLLLHHRLSMLLYTTLHFLSVFFLFLPCFPLLNLLSRHILLLLLLFPALLPSIFPLIWPCKFQAQVRCIFLRLRLCLLSDFLLFRLFLLFFCCTVRPVQASF